MTADHPLAADDHSVRAARLLAGPAPARDTCATLALVADRVQGEAPGTRAPGGSRRRPVLVAQYAHAGLIRAEDVGGPPDALKRAGRLTHAQALPARLAGDGLAREQIAAELGISPNAVTARFGTLLALLGVSHNHQAVALVALADRAARINQDFRGRESWPSGTAPWTAASHLAQVERVAVVAPAPQHAEIAAHVAGQVLGRRGRILVCAPAGVAWRSTLKLWRRQVAADVPVIGAASQDQLRHSRLREHQPRGATVWNTDLLRGAIGASRGAIVVVTPEAVHLVAAMHRRWADTPPWELLSVLGVDSATDPALYDNRVLPALRRLSIASAAEQITEDRSRHWQLPTAQIGPVAGRVPVTRPIRLLPTPLANRFANSGALSELKPLLRTSPAEVPARSVLVVCGSTKEAVRIHRALAGPRGISSPTAGLRWCALVTGADGAAEREEVLARLTAGTEELRVVVTAESLELPGPVDTVVWLGSRLTPGEMVDLMERARLGGSDQRPLSVIAPVPARGDRGPESPGRADILGSLARATASVDPRVARNLLGHRHRRVLPPVGAVPAALELAAWLACSLEEERWLAMAQRTAVRRPLGPYDATPTGMPLCAWWGEVMAERGRGQAAILLRRVRDGTAAPWLRSAGVGPAVGRTGAAAPTGQRLALPPTRTSAPSTGAAPRPSRELPASAPARGGEASPPGVGLCVPSAPTRWPSGRRPGGAPF